MKISMRKFGILSIFVVFILIESVSFATYQTAVLGEEEKKNSEAIRIQIEQEEVFLSEEETETLNLINEYRKQNGLSELQPFSKLQEVSKLKAEDLVNNQYFSHTSKNLGTPFEMLQNNEINYKIAGENLAGNITPKRAVEAWMNSPSHKENILEEKFEYTGISVIESPIYGRIFVQLFIGI